MITSSGGVGVGLQVAVDVPPSPNVQAEAYCPTPPLVVAVNVSAWFTWGKTGLSVKLTLGRRDVNALTRGCTSTICVSHGYSSLGSFLSSRKYESLALLPAALTDCREKVQLDIA